MNYLKSDRISFLSQGIIFSVEPAIFLDRDGVLIENRPSYIRCWEDVKIFPQALAALVRIKDAPYKIILVTNQSAVGRGLISLETACEINRRFIHAIECEGGRIDSVFMCPHAPKDECGCRKPKPGLLLQAARELSLDLSQSILIGDAISDLQAGQAAGVYQTVLVRTGLGAAQAALPHASLLKPYRIFDTVSDALLELIEYP
jgi:D-glycero-D-manno-heptose 1,7-bisphosphate phosphatase